MSKMLVISGLILSFVALILSVYTLVIKERDMINAVRAVAIDVSRMSIEVNERLNSLNQNIIKINSPDPLVKQINDEIISIKRIAQITSSSAQELVFILHGNTPNKELLKQR